MKSRTVIALVIGIAIGCAAAVFCVALVGFVAGPQERFAPLFRDIQSGTIVPGEHVLQYVKNTKPAYEKRVESSTGSVYYMCIFPGRSGTITTYSKDAKNIAIHVVRNSAQYDERSVWHIADADALLEYFGLMIREFRASSDSVGDAPP